MTTTTTTQRRMKYLPATVTKSPTDGSGSFVAVVSTFGPPPDTQGDIINVGAYDRNILDWQMRGRWPTVWYLHAIEDPINAVGKVTDMRATTKKLIVAGQLDLVTERGQVVYEAMLTDKINEWSIGYAVVSEHLGEWEGKTVNFIDELELIEVSLVPSGANRFTETLSVKSGHREATWAGTGVPRRMVEDLRARASGLIEGFLDELYATETKETPMQTRDADLRRQIDALSPDADLLRQLDELDGKAAAPRPVVVGPVADVLTHAAALFEQNAVRALSAGLVDEAESLMEYARELRAITAGSGGDVQAIIDTVVPIISALRNGGATVAGDNLERAVFELQGGATNVVTNQDRVEGSVNTDVPKAREPEALPRGSVQVTVDERMRPVEAPAPIPVDDGGMWRLPVVTVEDVEWTREEEA